MLMLRTCTLLLVLTSAGLAAAQIDQLPQSGQAPAPSQAPPRSDHEAGVSSSRDTKIDISPPKDDAKSHPSSDSSIADEPDDDSDVQEMHPWNPHKAAKDLEVGDFYFRRKNYRAALERYREAPYTSRTMRSPILNWQNVSPSSTTPLRRSSITVNI